MRRAALQGRAVTWAVTFGGELVGQVSVGNIVWGSERTGYLGAWVDERYARLAIMSIAVPMAVDHSFNVLGLHRLVAGIRPENIASRQGVEKAGFREEGLAVRMSYVDGMWRDHVCYAITVEEWSDLSTRWRSIIMAPKSG